MMITWKDFITNLYSQWGSRAKCEKPSLSQSPPRLHCRAFMLTISSSLVCMQGQVFIVYLYYIHLFLVKVLRKHAPYIEE